MTVTLTFDFTGSYQTFKVPPGVTAIRMYAGGAQGGLAVSTPALDTEGAGNYVQDGTSPSVWTPVIPGEVLRIYVGGRPAQPSSSSVPGAGGFNGGGAGGNGAGGGGGASDIRRTPYTLADRLMAGGGGGGWGSTGASTDNSGGGTFASSFSYPPTTGRNGADATDSGPHPSTRGGKGTGGLQSSAGTGGAGAVGANAGSNGGLGVGGDGGSGSIGGGGGGGGWYGGGGGGQATAAVSGVGGGGGGGGSAASPSPSSLTGVATHYLFTQHGRVIFEYDGPLPTTPRWGFNIHFGNRGPGFS